MSIQAATALQHYTDQLQNGGNKNSWVNGMRISQSGSVAYYCGRVRFEKNEGCIRVTSAVLHSRAQRLPGHNRFRFDEDVSGPNFRIATPAKLELKISPDDGYLFLHKNGEAACVDLQYDETGVFFGLHKDELYAFFFKGRKH